MRKFLWEVGRGSGPKSGVCPGGGELDLEPEVTVGDIESCQHTHSAAFIDFADDACVLARCVRMVELQVATLQQVFATAGHRLNVAKYEKASSSR